MQIINNKFPKAIETHENKENRAYKFIKFLE